MGNRDFSVRVGSTVLYAVEDPVALGGKQIKAGRIHMGNQAVAAQSDIMNAMHIVISKPTTAT